MISPFPPTAAHPSAFALVLFTSRLEPPRNRQETAKRLESRVESARGPLSEPARAAKRLESARGPLFEPPRDRLPRDSSRLVAPPGSKGSSQARLESGSSPLGSCTTLAGPGGPPSNLPYIKPQLVVPFRLLKIIPTVSVGSLDG